MRQWIRFNATVELEIPVNENETLQSALDRIVPESIIMDYSEDTQGVLVGYINRILYVEEGILSEPVG